MNEKYNKELEKMFKDSDMIFNQITKSGGFDNINDVNRAIVMLYLPDMTISRGGISHALKRLERYYGDE